MSDSHLEPDYSVEVFVLAPEPSDGAAPIIRPLAPSGRDGVVWSRASPPASVRRLGPSAVGPGAKVRGRCRPRGSASPRLLLVCDGHARSDPSAARPAHAR